MINRPDLSDWCGFSYLENLTMGLRMVWQRAHHGPISFGSPAEKVGKFSSGHRRRGDSN